jgi:hypothetical protein
VHLRTHVIQEGEYFLLKHKVQALSYMFLILIFNREHVVVIWQQGYYNV